jgi:2'-5' RNA ligase
MPKTTRTFIALEIPQALSDRLSRLQTMLAERTEGVRWTANLPFHVTLAFLGDVADTDLKSVCTAVAAAVSPFAPFEVQLRGVGAFPTPERPRVIWAGLDAPVTLHDLQKTIVKAVSRAGYRPDDQRFTPHTTLGRIKADRRKPPPTGVAAALVPYQTWSGGAFTVTEAVTFASTLTPDGPEYAPLSRATLDGKTGVAP